MLVSRRSLLGPALVIALCIFGLEVMTMLTLDQIVIENRYLEAIFNAFLLIAVLIPLIIALLVRPARLEADRASHATARYTSIVDHAGEAVLIFDKGLSLKDANGVAENWFGDLKALNDQDQLLDVIGARQAVRDALAAALSGGDRDVGDGVYESMAVSAKGVSFPVAIRTGLVRLLSGAVPSDTEIVVLVRDISLRVQKNQELQDQRNLMEALVQALPAPVFFKDCDGRYMGCNESFEEFIGYRNEEIVGKTVHDIAPQDLAEMYEAADQSLFDAGGHQVYDAQVESSTGRRMDVVFHKSVFEQGSDKKPGIVGVMTDITQQKELERKLTHLSLHDTLTGVPNRMHFIRHLSQAIFRARRHGRSLAVFFIDLDGFKEVNDTLGHDAGDTVLRQIAQRLQKVMRQSDFIARFGGDEFVVMAEEVSDRSSVDSVAAKLMDAVSESCPVKGETRTLSTSIGIAFYPDQGDTPDDLINHADQAMYHAKSQGRNCYYIWGPEMPASNRPVDREDSGH